MENTKILKHIFIFRGLNQIQLAQFNKVMRHDYIAKGSRLIKEGDEPNGMYIVLKGSFNVVKQGYGGEEVLAKLGEGEHFGEIGLIDERPRSASVEATDRGEVLFLSRQDFERILGEFPEIKLKIYKNFLESLCERLRSANENLLVAAQAGVK